MSRALVAIAALVMPLVTGAGPVAADAEESAVNWMVASGGVESGPSRSYGFVIVRGVDDSSIMVTVHILRGVPDERYTVNINGVGDIGDIYTNARGNGQAHIMLTSGVTRYPGNPFRIDVHLFCDISPGACGPRWGQGGITGPIALP